jgi:hypothetical protein
MQKLLKKKMEECSIHFFNIFRLAYTTINSIPMMMTGRIIHDEISATVGVEVEEDNEEGVGEGDVMIIGIGALGSGVA